VANQATNADITMKAGRMYQIFSMPPRWLAHATDGIRAYDVSVRTR
jgi:hypothetical protein